MTANSKDNEFLLIGVDILVSQISQRNERPTRQAAYTKELATMVMPSPLLSGTYFVQGRQLEESR